MLGRQMCQAIRWLTWIFQMAVFLFWAPMTMVELPSTQEVALWLSALESSIGYGKMRSLACSLIPQHIVPGRAYDVKMLVGIWANCVLVGGWVCMCLCLCLCQCLCECIAMITPW